MIVFDFIYFCIYSFVLDKAIFGKRDVACTFLAISTSVFLMGLLTVFALRFKFEINVTLSVIILLGGLFILARMIYLKPAKFRSMHRRFGKIPKWLLKTIGILYILLCFASFIILGSLASLK